MEESKKVSARGTSEASDEAEVLVAKAREDLELSDDDLDAVSGGMQFDPAIPGKTITPTLGTTSLNPLGSTVIDKFDVPLIANDPFRRK